MKPDLIQSLQSTEARAFIHDHEQADAHDLMLKKKSIGGLPYAILVQQISGLQKAKDKLPTWYNSRGVIYPPGLNIEQSSSEVAAKFKSNVIQRLLGKAARRGADLTGGLGVDAWALSRESRHFDYVEPIEDLYLIAKHNHKALGCENIFHHHTTAESFLQTDSDKFDFIFIDPSRRKQGQKVFRLSDCVPDVVSLRSLIMAKTDLAIVKTSPLLDIQQGLRELVGVSDAFVVAVMNECKELLFVFRASDAEVDIHAVDLDRNGGIISKARFTPSQEKDSIVQLSGPLTYLYEPNAAILKAGGFKWVGAKFGLKKLAVNTHLYTSDTLIDFPGRIFQLVEQVKLDKRLKGRFENGIANIISRNHPLTVAEIRKKTGLKEGGDQYLICAQDSSKKYAFIATRL